MEKTTVDSLRAIVIRLEEPAQIEMQRVRREFVGEHQIGETAYLPAEKYDPQTLSRAEKKAVQAALGDALAGALSDHAAELAAIRESHAAELAALHGELDALTTRHAAELADLEARLRAMLSEDHNLQGEVQTYEAAGAST